jgi:hypothetical protein
MTFDDQVAMRIAFKGFDSVQLALYKIGDDIKDAPQKESLQRQLREFIIILAKYIEDRKNDLIKAQLAEFEISMQKMAQIDTILKNKSI